jgi:hypothetical protein
MAKAVRPTRIVLDGHDVTHLCAGATIGIKAGSVRTVTLVLFDPKIEGDSETGELTITVET